MSGGGLAFEPDELKALIRLNQTEDFSKFKNALGKSLNVLVSRLVAAGDYPSMSRIQGSCLAITDILETINRAEQILETKLKTQKGA